MIKNVLISACIVIQASCLAFEDDLDMLLGEAPAKQQTWSGVFEANLLVLDGQTQSAIGTNQFARLESYTQLWQGQWVNHAQIDFDYINHGWALPMFVRPDVADRAVDLEWQDIQSHHQWHTQLDWSYWQRSFANSSLTVGRQPVTLGLGRVFSPTDPLGAFNVFDLDRLYKSGVDAIKYDYFLTGSVQTQSIATVNNHDHLQLLQTIKGSLAQGVWLVTLAHREEQNYISVSAQHYIAGLDVDGYTEYLYGSLSNTSETVFKQDSHQRMLLGISTKMGANGTLAIEWLQQTLAANTQSDYTLWQQRYKRSNITNLGIAKRYLAVSYADEWNDLTRYELLAMQNLVDDHINVSAVITHSASDNLQLRFALAYTPSSGPINSEFEQFSDLVQLGIRYYF
ncbi:hypothetical protein CWC18_10345 [Pseudoalteromonas aurantia]|uniref:Porin n=1 Tax=Pseudoalteromonas aurantia TaxID=43654 RepID=A0A5S3V749_9GAMM|nr:hypothetical protein CWC18_10345 [Pseudoalteromonas aurantia]TMO67554.1 hypothetical protein CWC19_13515 [Pseudoalteromonas aurantia]TMO73327.1 hypothetical protein CWC20_13510 [Pseudoalteromonas aurantia]